MNIELCSCCKGEHKSSEGVFVEIKQESQFYCIRCYNDMMAELSGITFENAMFNPMKIKDSDKMEHTFFFESRLLGNFFIIEADEQLDDDKQGYKFSVLGKVDEDQFDLFKVLFERIKRSVGQKHIEPCHLNKYRVTDQDIIRGYITTGFEGSAGSPLLVIDGKEVEWNGFGRMLSVYEGFNFKLELFDKTEEK